MAIHGVVGPQMPKNARVRAPTGEPLLKRLIICNQCRRTARNGFGQERDRAWEGQQGLGLHALACFLAATALNPWRFDAISAPGCSHQPGSRFDIAISPSRSRCYRRFRAFRVCLDAASFHPPHPPGIRIRPAFASAWHSAQSGPVLVQLPVRPSPVLPRSPIRPNPVLPQIPVRSGLVPPRLLIRQFSFARLVLACKLSPSASRLRLGGIFVKRRVRLGFAFVKAPVCPSA